MSKPGILKDCNPKLPQATDPNYVCNHKTGKWVKRDGAVARREKIGIFASAPSKPKAKFKAVTQTKSGAPKPKAKLKAATQAKPKTQSVTKPMINQLNQLMLF